MHLPAGQHLGQASRYVITRPLAVGGFGVVYEAQDPKGRPVAIKTIAVAKVKGASIARLQREAKLLRRVRHPHLIRCLDHGHDPALGLYFLVMPFVPHPTLEARLRAGPPMLLADVVRVLSCVAGALDALHRHGLTHRDVKPSNILVGVSLSQTPPQTPQLNVTLIDLGLALIAGDERLTATGNVVGSPLHMAPEQIAGLPTDGRADLYALGVTAFQMLTGHPPFTGSTAAEVLEKHLYLSPKPLSDFRPDLPPAASACLSTLLAKSPTLRPASASVWVKDFCHALRPSPPSSPSPHFPTRQHPTQPAFRPPFARIIAGLLLGALILWALLSLRNR